MFRSTVLLWLLSLGACRPQSIVVSIEDPNHIAARADSIALGMDRAHPSETRSLSGRSFPVTLALTKSGAERGTLFASALENGIAIAGTSTIVDFSGTRSAVRADLFALCTNDADCDDHHFCNGRESCANGLCQSGAPPCPRQALPCVELVCNESEQVCEVTSAMPVDDGNPCTLDVCIESDGGTLVKHDPDPSKEGQACAIPDGGTGRCTSGVCGAS
jgi:hypothetical protein